MHNRLMDYLYDELDAVEKQEVEQWLADNPEARAELAALQQTRGFLAQLPSVKPAKPAPVTSSSLRISRRWLPAISTAAAAAILLLLMVSNVKIETYDGGMSISLGKAQEVQQNQVQQAPPADAIASAVAENNAIFYKKLDSIQQSLEQQLLANQQDLQQDWLQRWTARQANYEAQLKTLAGKEFQQKYPQLAALMQDMQLEQQQEMRYLLTELWNNWQQVRNDDLKAIERNFVMLNQNVELNRQGTEELFKNILMRTNTGD